MLRKKRKAPATPVAPDYKNLTKDQLKNEVLMYPMGATQDDINVLKAKIRIIGTVLETESRGMFSGDKITHALGRKFDFKATELPDVQKAHAVLGLHQEEALSERSISRMHEMHPYSMGVDHRVVALLGQETCLTAPSKLQKAQHNTFPQAHQR